MLNASNDFREPSLSKQCFSLPLPIHNVTNLFENLPHRGLSLSLNAYDTIVTCNAIRQTVNHPMQKSIHLVIEV